MHKRCDLTRQEKKQHHFLPPNVAGGLSICHLVLSELLKSASGSNMFCTELTSNCPVAAEEAASSTSKSALHFGTFLEKTLLCPRDPRMRDHGRRWWRKCSETTYLNLQIVFIRRDWDR